MPRRNILAGRGGVPLKRRGFLLAQNIKEDKLDSFWGNNVKVQGGTHLLNRGFKKKAKFTSAWRAS